VTPEVTAWPERLLLTAAVVGVIALAAWGMWRGWRRRSERESEQIAPLASIPDNLTPATLQVSGSYVGTVRHGNWMVRLLAHGLGAPGAAVASVHTEGVLFDREGQEPLFIPTTAMTEVTTGRGLAGTVREKDGIAVIGWQWGEEDLDTGFRSPDAPAQQAFLTSTVELLGNQEGQSV
jgi:hypothetical protein